MPFNTGLYGTNFSLLIDRTPLVRAVRRLARRMRKDTELQLTLNGAAAGSAASSTYGRVAHSITELGGVRPIETRTVVSRNTTAADKTNIDNMLSEDSRITTPSNGAGNWDA